MWALSRCISVLALVASAHSTFMVAQQSETQFCWKNSIVRGIGQIPQACPPGHEKIGLFCYATCPPGFARFGFDCHSVCPDGLRDDGLFCRKPEYGRGVGYPWKFGDALNDKGMFDRCEKDNEAGNCEKYGLVVYPKCNKGYEPFGCCICRPPLPNCGALGMGQFDLSCAKKIIIGRPSLGHCADDEERDAGLCYKKCSDKYTGVGPVCWGQPPTGWVDCGMGAASSKLKCLDAVKDQVFAVTKLAINICTAFSASSASTLLSPAVQTKIDELKALWDSIKDTPAVKKLREMYEKANQAKLGYASIEELLKAKTTADYVRMAAAFTAMFDPSGVSTVVLAFSYDTCDKMPGVSLAPVPVTTTAPTPLATPITAPTWPSVISIQAGVDGTTCLDDGNVKPCQDQDNQKWTYMEWGGLKNVKSGKCLDRVMDSQNVTHVQNGDCTRSIDQMWRLTGHALMPVDKDECAEIGSDNILVNKCTNTTNQQFQAALGLPK